MSYTEAMEEFGLDENSEPMERFEAVCQWELGDPGWAETIIEWLEQSGFKVEPVG